MSAIWTSTEPCPGFPRMWRLRRGSSPVRRPSMARFPPGPLVSTSNTSPWSTVTSSTNCWKPTPPPSPRIFRSRSSAGFRSGCAGSPEGKERRQHLWCPSASRRRICNALSTNSESGSPHMLLSLKGSCPVRAGSRIRCSEDCRRGNGSSSSTPINAITSRSSTTSYGVLIQRTMQASEKMRHRQQIPLVASRDAHRPATRARSSDASRAPRPQPLVPSHQ